MSNGRRWMVARALMVTLGLAAGAWGQGLPETAVVLPEAAPAANPMAVYGSAAGADPVGPGDLLDVRVFGQPQLSGNLRVGPDGVIAPAFVAPLPVAGKTPLQIQALLGTSFASMLLHPLVSVRVVEN
ncbi:MAG: polysaccharide biosynthesis/export family protein, partial [Terriglobales bacterium]